MNSYSQFEKCVTQTAVMIKDTLHLVIVDDKNQMKHQKYYRGKLCYEWVNKECKIYNPLLTDDLELFSKNYLLIDLKKKDIKPLVYPKEKCLSAGLESFFKIGDKRFLLKIESCSFTRFNWGAIDNINRQYGKIYLAEIDSNLRVSDYELFDNDERISTNEVCKVKNEEKAIFYKGYGRKSEYAWTDLVRADYLEGVEVFTFDGNEITEINKVIEVNSETSKIFNNYIIKIKKQYYFFYYENSYERDSKMFYKKSDDLKIWSDSVLVAEGNPISSYSYSKDNVYFLSPTPEGYNLIKFDGQDFAIIRNINKTFNWDTSIIKSLGIITDKEGRVKIEDQFYIDSEENIYIVYRNHAPQYLLKIIYIQN